MNEIMARRKLYKKLKLELKIKNLTSHSCLSEKFILSPFHTYKKGIIVPSTIYTLDLSFG